MSGLLSCAPTWEGTGGARGIFGLYRLAIYSCKRVIVWVQYIRRSVLRVGQTAAPCLPKTAPFLPK